MSLIRWAPVWDPFEDFVPAVDMYETKDAVVVETPLVGVKPEKVVVTVEKGVLTVKGESKKEHEVDDKNYYRKEVRSGSFFRQVALPVAVKEDKVSAEFADGVLKITCPKSPQVAVKKINVKIIKKSDKK
ncbi:Hsp20/alpha crystallin family protein [Candidatus Gottesmanbacteria bacterium]|nr:Hsp20/alpha crystallin family protein [Candidatus Gottesmanbacteria bacterium]